jgi:hypothetical protein
LLALALSTLACLCGLAAVVFAYHRTISSDFLSFWAAGALTLQGHAAGAYDIARHHAMEMQAIPKVGLLPFPYPPAMLALFAPLGALPYWLALGVWIAITSAIYVVASRRWIDVRFSLAQAAAAANFAIGQNGFLTSGIFIAGMGMIDRRPVLAGTLLGLLSVKPQLAILLPVALLASRAWRTIGAAIASSVVLALLGLLLFGAQSYASFAALLPNFSHWLSAGRWPWGELASSFALLRWFGVPQPIALAVHAAIALVAAGLTARAWALKLDQRIAILASATLLASPYLFTYDALLLTLPLSALARREGGKGPFIAVWLLSLPAVVAYVTPFPNALPIAAMVALWALHADNRQSGSTTAG